MSNIDEKKAKQLLIDNGYDVIKNIGEGGFGIVFECKKNNKVMAVKVMLGTKQAINREKLEVDELDEIKPKSWDDFALHDINTKRKFNSYYKYIMIPKFVKETKDSDKFWAIFEAPIASGDVARQFEIWKENLQDAKEMRIHLTKLAKQALKGLSVLHKNKKYHGDVNTGNLLTISSTSKKSGKGKIRYMLNDRSDMVESAFDKNTVVEENQLLLDHLIWNDLSQLQDTLEQLGMKTNYSIWNDLIDKNSSNYRDDDSERFRNFFYNLTAKRNGRPLYRDAIEALEDPVFKK